MTTISAMLAGTLVAMNLVTPLLAAENACLQNNRIWDTGGDGFVTPDPVPGYPTTSGYDLTTGWGSPVAPGYVSQLVARP